MLLGLCVAFELTIFFCFAYSMVISVGNFLQESYIDQLYFMLNL